MEGRGATAALAGAEADLDALLATDRQATTFGNRGTVRRYQGMYLSRRGRDATAAFDRSEADFDAAMAMAPSDPSFVAGRCRTRTRRADALAAEGRADEALVALALAEIDCTSALARPPGETAALSWRGDLRTLRGAIRRQRGALAAAEADFAAAEADFAAMALHQPNQSGWIALLSGRLETERGVLAVVAGRDPRLHWQTAARRLEIAHETLVGHLDPRVERARLQLERGLSPGARGREVATALARAGTDLAAVLAADPEHRDARALESRRARALSRGGPRSRE